MQLFPAGSLGAGPLRQRCRGPYAAIGASTPAETRNCPPSTVTVKVSTTEEPSRSDTVATTMSTAVPTAATPAHGPNAALPHRKPPRNVQLRAVLLMVASAVMFGSMAIVIRFASQQLHPFEIAFFRNLFGLLFALPLLLRGGWALLRTDKWWYYLLRCAIGMVGMLCGFWAIVNLPLAQAIALSYSTPLFVTIGAVLVLGEIVRMRRWSAVIVGFLGVLVIVRPGADSFQLAALVPLLGA